ncbi:MAG: hypothetical protein IJW27_05780 [Clostridia bacterium]|nr:hypothetical protein [Clostridia bacterium]
MNCKIADFKVTIKNRGGLIARLCEKYIDDFSSPDFTVAVSDDDLLNEPTPSPTKAYLESIAACRKLAYMLPAKDAFLLHAATFEIKGRGIAFLAKSGTGKSTHMLLWKELFGEELRVVNGDKPIVRLKDDTPFAYGTPWCGKEGLSENRGIPLTDICFIVRSDKNETVALSPEEAVNRLFSQVIIPSGSENILKIMELLDKTIKKCRLWEIRCNTDLDAAKISSKKILEVK